MRIAARDQRRRMGLAPSPRRNPIISWDIPRRPDPLPKFLDDANAARFMQAAYQ